MSSLRPSLIVAVLCAAGCASPVVGAQCASGLTQCGNVCVDLQFDPNHCGMCDRACPSEQYCVYGVCSDDPPDGSVRRRDGGKPDAGEGGVSDMDGAIDGGVRDGGMSDSGSVDGGGVLSGCDLGELDCNGVCVDATSDPTNCGACGRTCGDGEVCADAECAGACTTPNGLCDGRCFDLSRDPDHCGACDVRCESGVCIDGSCSGPLAGHLVIIGHDFRVSRSGMNRIAGNSVFLARGTPVEAVVFEGTARAESISGVNNAIDQVALAIGRSWTRTTVEASEVPLALDDADVFVIHAQHFSADEELDALGAGWTRALASFLRTGRVVVLFDGSGANGGTHGIAVRAGLLDSTGSVDVSGRLVDVVQATDAVALGVPLRYLAEQSSVRFRSSERGVVSDGTGPVVIHRTVVP